MDKDLQNDEAVSGPTGKHHPSKPQRPEKRFSSALRAMNQVGLSLNLKSFSSFIRFSCKFRHIFGKKSFISTRNYFDLNIDISNFNCVQFNSGSFLALATKHIQKSGLATVFLALKMDRVSEMKRETAAKSGCIENSNLD